MATAHWAEILDAGDPAAARAAWQQDFAADGDSPQATWELAEIEERWGDALFFAGESGAAAHYQAAWRALAPPGARFSSLEESERRMAAYARVTVKLQAIDPHGKARTGNSGEPHPNFHAIELPKPAPEPVKPAPEAVEAPPPVPRQQSGFADLFRMSDHWRHCGLGAKWRDAGRELAAAFPEAARCAYQWSLDYFTLYNQAWTAHLPASRWDPDGGEDIEEVQSLMSCLGDNRPDAALPAWVEALLAGDWQRASAALGDTVAPPEFKAVAAVLSVARDAAAGRTRL